MPFGEYFKQWLFFWPLFCKAQLCGVYGLKWSYGQILKSPLWSFAAPSWLSLVYLLPLINALLAWSVSVWWVALSWQDCCGAISFPFLNNEFNGALWNVQRFCYCFTTQP